MSRRHAKMRDRTKKSADKAKNPFGQWFALPEGKELFKHKKGTNYIDIVPFEVSTNRHPAADKGELWWELSVDIHFKIGVKKQDIVCPGTFNQRCPICEYYAQIRNDPDADDQIASSFRARKRQLFNVDDGDEGVVKLWEMSYFLFGKKLMEEVREGEEEWADFPELEGGYTVKARFSEDSFKGNKFLDCSRIDFIERDDYDEEDILNDSVDPSSLITLLSYEEINAIFLEMDTVETADEPEEKPAPRRGRRGAKKEEEPEEKKKSAGDNKCPNGLTYGSDCNSDAVCDDCELWDDCQAAQDAE